MSRYYEYLTLEDGTVLAIESGGLLYLTSVQKNPRRWHNARNNKRRTIWRTV